MGDSLHSDQFITVHDLGRLDYAEGLRIQEALFEAAVARKMYRSEHPDGPLPENHLLLCEHPPVFTLGKSGSPQNLLLSDEALRRHGISFYRNNRGGDITYHGPGQLVGYPILDLEQFRPDVKAYMRSLEEVIIRTLAAFDLKGERIESATGVWLDADRGPGARKICAFGVRISRWVTMHGWALNINTHLDHFRYIIPCGIPDKGVTSMERELGRRIDPDDVKTMLLKNFEAVFGLPVRPGAPL